VTLKIDNGAGAPIADAVVIFDPIGSAASPAPDTATAVVDQINRRFVPHIQVVQRGTAVAFPNSDHIRHQVYSFSPPKTFTLKLYAGSPQTNIVFDNAGLVVLGCNIHDSMVGFIAVVDTPYFTKTPSTGIATMDLPAGTYRLRLWHPELATPYPAQTVKVNAGEQTISIQAPLDHANAAPSPWPE
jgi:plastocyanin